MFLKLSGRKLKIKNGSLFDFGKICPYLVFTTNDTGFIKYTQTGYIKRNVHPEWPTYRINMEELCNKDPHQKIKVRCFCYNKRVLVGKFYTNWESLSRPGCHKFQLKMAEESTGVIKIEKIINNLSQLVKAVAIPVHSQYKNGT